MTITPRDPHVYDLFADKGLQILVRREHSFWWVATAETLNLAGQGSTPLGAVEGLFEAMTARYLADRSFANSPTGKTLAEMLDREQGDPDPTPDAYCEEEGMNDTEIVNWLADMYHKVGVWNARHSHIEGVKMSINVEESVEHERLVYRLVVCDPVDTFIDVSHDDFRKMIEEAARQWRAYNEAKPE